MDTPGFLPQDPPDVASFATATPTAFAAAALPWRPPPLPLGMLPRLRGKSTGKTAPESIVDATYDSASDESNEPQYSNVRKIRSETFGEFYLGTFSFVGHC